MAKTQSIHVVTLVLEFDDEIGDEVQQAVEREFLQMAKKGLPLASVDDHEITVVDVGHLHLEGFRSVEKE